MEKKLAILHPDLTLKDEALDPFWNEVSQEINALLWQPRKIVLQGQDTDLSNTLLNYQEEKLDYWKKKLIPKTLTQTPLLVSSRALSIPIMESEQQSLKETIVTKKVRIFPKNEEKFFEALHVFRRAYNLTIESFKNRNEEPSSDLRRSICDLIKKEKPKVFNVDLIYEAYRKACTTRSQIISLRKKKQEANYSFMSWKYSPKYFKLLKLGANGTIYPRQLGEVFYTEKIPEYSLGKNTVIKYEHGEWYACLQDTIETPRIKRTKKNIVALDPGVRTFITSYNDKEVSIYGENFSKEKLLPLALRVNKLISLRDKLYNQFRKMNKEDLPKWYLERMVYFRKAIVKLKAKRNHLIEDIHNKICFDLITNNDIILLPTFNTSKMVKKGKRKIRKKTVKEMLDLCHYKFKLRLKWMAKKYGKIVLEVNEAYTSKTYNGKILNIGSSKTIKRRLKNGNMKYIDRDINGARNILIRFLTKSNAMKMA
jgi:putative transposase